MVECPGPHRSAEHVEIVGKLLLERLSHLADLSRDDVPRHERCSETDEKTHMAWKTIAATIDASMPLTIVQAAMASADMPKPPSSTSDSKRCHHRCRPTARCAVSERI